MTTLKIQNEANIYNANGIKRRSHAKPLMCIETGETYASTIDAAIALGVSQSMVSTACRGKAKTLKGKHYFYIAKANENLDAITTHIRIMNDNCAELEFKAKRTDDLVRENLELKRERADLIAAQKEFIEKYKGMVDLIMAIDKNVQESSVDMSA